MLMEVVMMSLSNYYYSNTAHIVIKCISLATKSHDFVETLGNTLLKLRKLKAGSSNSSEVVLMVSDGVEFNLGSCPSTLVSINNFPMRSVGVGVFPWRTQGM